jgi:hypothetical protein
VHITLETPYKLDARLVPKTRKEYQDDILERRRWNDGGQGTLIREPPAPDGHPLPRVIIDVTRVRGAHRKDELQRELRRSMWIKVVDCYRLGAYLNQKLRGKTMVTAELSAKGKVTRARLTTTTLDDPHVAQCLPIALKALPLPKARSISTATVEIQIGAGDDPMPPPPSALTPGPGSLGPDAVLAVLTEAVPKLEACYRGALDYAPELWGRIAIRLHVTRSGQVDEAFQTESRFPDEGMLRCVLKQARTLAFPAPAGGDLRIVAPVRFSTERVSPAGVQASGVQGDSLP